MKHTASSYVKLTLASMLVLLASCACAWRLMKIQIVESDTYTAKRVSTQEYTQTIMLSLSRTLSRRTTPRATRCCSLW